MAVRPYKFQAQCPAQEQVCKGDTGCAPSGAIRLRGGRPKSRWAADPCSTMTGVMAVVQCVTECCGARPSR